MQYSKHAVKQLKARFPNKMVEGQADIVTMHQLFSAAKETKRFHNNTAYIVYMLDRYGDCNCKFFENEDMIFIVKEDDIVVTVVDSNTPPIEKGVFRKDNTSGYRKGT